ncbi:hypothetical protein EYM_00925 [Ignicoccus islandicus DSM 13165]|uniref:Uncharacterized protein n=1 Tax=Ignicoccus islandicus DSM 13165 TaxID=940295 RepID=A0A0U2MAD8_9CREN|nr:hypothetical protein [Ignicoccus islandicus]ALU12157.1 hypothetical protein EYM_00925 [Ignicoccus islandicus DSM 13165]
MRAWLIAVALSALLLAKCVVFPKDLGLSVQEEEVLEVGLLAKVYMTKVKANVILLTPDNEYRFEMKKLIMDHFKKASEFLNIANRDLEAGVLDEAFIYYLATFREAYVSYHLIDLAKANDLTQLANKIEKIGETVSSLAYTSLKVALNPRSCVNVTRVAYVYNYYTFKEVVNLLNDTLNNIPGEFNKELAHKIQTIYEKVSNLLAYSLLQSYMQTWNLDDKAVLPNKEAPCLNGIGPRTDWLPKACYVVQNPSSDGSIKYPCQKAVGALAYLLGDQQMMKVMCSLG